ncbi:DUF2178 domain-containing protein [Patescibacteria group bacterium]|nr:DUF2178 domain-containing protein [Patescibacteria group bacterium]MCL5409444.1 DUF2178 domain-containing protein [Patescibacteria group bacterium]
MNQKRYNQLRVAVTLFVGMIVALAVINNSYLLSFVAVITGMIFMALVRSRVQIKTDERESVVQEKAARLTYAIFAPTLGIGAFLMLVPSGSGLSVFSKGEFLYLESLGMVFAYLTLFLITIYAISYYFLNRKYGGGGSEE